MPPLPVSVIVVSRHRPLALQRCISALRQQDHTGFELIVIADPDAAAQTASDLQRAGLTARVQAFDEANISVARNRGLVLAMGAVVAFIDDDAVAEPTWLSRLTAPFADPAVVAATGFVRGRNGISYQWRACEVDALAQDHDLDLAKVTMLQGTSSRAVKTQGTNCAFRRDALLAIGGFDPALRFYLDDACVSLRLAALGPTAIVPDAEVLHGYAASARRRRDRVPLSLHEIAASTAVFLRRHAPDADLAVAWLRLQHREAQRIATHRIAKRIGDATAKALLQGLEEGWQDGLNRPILALKPLATVAGFDFLPLPGTGPRGGCVIAGRFWQKAGLLAQARQQVAAGKIVSVFCLAPTVRRHRAEYCSDGYWLQTGGIFGQSLRSGRKMRLIGFSARVEEEVVRIAAHRPTK